MSRMEYTVSYSQGGLFGSTYNCTRYVSFNDTKDHRQEIKDDLYKEHGADPSFDITAIIPNERNPIDYAIIDRMKAIRLMCELGHRVRADAKIKNRQPLRKAYVSFLDKEISDFMLYIDCGKEEYASIIRDELNVFEVEWITGDETRFFDYTLKPNFRSLGKKNLGKQAQILKTDLVKMATDEANALYAKLRNGDTVLVKNVPLTLDDVEVALLPKPGYAATSDKVGAIILDTKLDDFLMDRGFVAEFRAEMQRWRKESKLELTDKIALEVYAYGKGAAAIKTMADSLKKHLLITELVFCSMASLDEPLCHKMDIDGQKLWVKMWKEVG